MEAVLREAREMPISHAFGLKFPTQEQFSKLRPEDQRVGVLLAREAGLKPPLEIAAPRLDTPPSLRVRDFDTDLGTANAQPFGFDLARLLDGRMLVQGASGAGKSWTLRRIIEQTASSIQQVVIDPEGEFSSIPDHFPHTRIEAHRLDSAALAVLAARVRAHRLSVVVDMSEMDRDGQLQGIAAIFDALVNAPRTQWSPCLVVVDEAHLFAPFGGQSAATTAVRKAALKADSGVGLAALLAGMASRIGGPVKLRGEGMGSHYDPDAPAFIDAFTAFMAMDTGALLQAAAEAVATTLDLRVNHAPHIPFDRPAAAIAERLGAKVMHDAIIAAFDARDYFGGAANPVVLAAITEAVGEEAARTAGKLKKADLVEFAVKNVVPTGWLPPEMRWPGYPGPGVFPGFPQFGGTDAPAASGDDFDEYGEDGIDAEANEAA